MSAALLALIRDHNARHSARVDAAEEMGLADTWLLEVVLDEKTSSATSCASSHARRDRRHPYFRQRSRSPAGSARP